VSLWDASLVHALPATLLTVVGISLRRAARDPKTPRGDAVLADLGLGLVTVFALVLWFQVLVSIVF
jgi:hypothetical protein